MTVELEKINTNPKTLEEASQTIGQLIKIIIEQQKEINTLKEKLNANSNNSSLPPSRDIKRKKKNKIKSGKKRGGQPGHKAHQRIIIPVDQLTEIVNYKPKDICDCGGSIKLSDKIHKHQVFEIPIPRYEVIEYFLRRSRGKKIAKEIIGPLNDRIMITDRYSAYNYLPDKNHQTCFAHLKRDFQKISEREGEAGLVGQSLLKAY